MLPQIAIGSRCNLRWVSGLSIKPIANANRLAIEVVTNANKKATLSDTIGKTGKIMDVYLKE